MEQCPHRDLELATPGTMTEVDTLPAAVSMQVIWILGAWQLPSRHRHVHSWWVSSTPPGYHCIAQSGGPGMCQSH